MDRDRLLSRQAIENLIFQGQHIVIKHDKVLQLDGWLERHPGGRLAIQHMVGRDASDEINIYHSARAIRMMNAFQIGRIDGPWDNLTPPIRGGIYAELEEEVHGPPYKDRTGALPETTNVNTCAVTSSQLGQPVLKRPHPVDASKDSGCRPSASSIQSAHERLHVFPANRTPPEAFSRPSGTELYSKHDHANKVLQEEIDAAIKEYPSLDACTQRNIILRYRKLHEEVKSSGLYNCDYVQYGKEILRYIFLFLAFFMALRFDYYLTSAIALGLFWHQIMFTAHDAGHRGITHNFIADTFIGMFIADFCCGLSIGWWKSSHNVHHLVTNHPEHDPDIQNVPLFATSLSFLKSLHSTYYNLAFVWDAFADIAIQYQAFTYYPVMALARFNLYFLSFCHILSPRSQTKGSAWWVRPTELAFMCCYWYLFGYLLVWRSLPTWTTRTAFVLISHITTMPLHVQITLSHWGMPTADLGECESFPQRQLRTTMDVDCPAWLDFVHGGLQFQACHHLFPAVPRHNLRKLQVLVKQFCLDTKIPYKSLGFADGNRVVLGKLGEVARQVRFLVECQVSIADLST